MSNTNETKRQGALSATIVGEVLHIEFAHGKRIELDASQLAADIVRAAEMHGLKQKLCDAAAISRNADTGKPASVEDKYQAVKAVFDRLIAGEWNTKREGTGGVSLLLKALIALYPKRTPESIREWLSSMDDAQRTALKVNPRVAAKIAELQSAKAGDIDSNELLEGLE